jgi:hypothetical protein
MAKRVAWISSIGPSDADIQKLIAMLQQYGLVGQGHVWSDDPDQMAWMGPREELLKAETSMWIILATPEGLQGSSVRYGLSLLALTVQAQRGSSFPMAVITVQSSGARPDLPTPLRSAACMALEESGLGPKIVALAHKKSGKGSASYHCDVYGNPRIGQWFEVGPAGEEWSGALFAVDQGEIRFHAVGRRGVLPERATLEYPSKGIQLELQNTTFTAWACRNRLSQQESYFVQVSGRPESILFGPFPENEDPELFTLKLV